MDFEKIDFDTFAIHIWDESSLPSLPLLTAKRKQPPKSAGSKRNQALIREATLKEIILDYQRNVPTNFERGIENSCVGHGMELTQRKSSRPGTSRPRSAFNPFAAPPLIIEQRPRSVKSPPKIRFKMRPVSRPVTAESIPDTPPESFTEFKKGDKREIPKPFERVRRSSTLSTPSMEEKEIFNPFAAPPAPIAPKSDKQRQKSAPTARSKTPPSPKIKKEKVKPKKKPEFNIQGRLNLIMIEILICNH